MPLVWVFNIVGTVDLVHALVQLPCDLGTFRLPCGGFLHFLLQLANDFQRVEILVRIRDDRALDLLAADVNAEAFLNGTDHALRGNPMFLVILNLLPAARYLGRHALTTLGWIGTTG